MDGSHRVVLHTIGVHRPSGITCDYTTRRIYWVDYSWHRIEYSNYDGTFRYVQLIAANLPPETLLKTGCSANTFLGVGPTLAMPPPTGCHVTPPGVYYTHHLWCLETP